MKTLKLGMMLMVIVLAITGCKKVEGPKGDKGDVGESGPDAKTYTYKLDYFAGDLYKSYSGIMSDYDDGDVIVTFIEDPNEQNLPGFWVQTPFVSMSGINFYAQITDDGIVL